MKKLSLIIISGLYLFTTSAFAEIGVNIGVSGSAGIFGATAKETHTTTATGSTTADSASEIAAVGYGSIFLEKEFGIITVGVDYVPTPFESETAETQKYDDQTANPAAAAVTAVVNKVQVDLTDLTTMYVGVNVTENAYVRFGYATMDVETNETLGTGSSYGNEDIYGGVIGLGAKTDQHRFELVYTDYEDISLTSSQARTGVTTNNKISAELDTVQFKYSYAF